MSDQEARTRPAASSSDPRAERNPRAAPSHKRKGHAMNLTATAWPTPTTGALQARARQPATRKVAFATSTPCDAGAEHSATPIARGSRTPSDTRPATKTAKESSEAHHN